MDGPLASPNPLIDELVTALAPVLRRMREDVDRRLNDIEAGFAERVEASGGQLHALVEESRRRAEDAIRETAEAVRALAGQVTAETRALPDRLTAQLALLPKPRDGRDAYLPIVAAWVAGRVYEAGEAATHRAGTWQAINRTTEEPGPNASGWRVLADGLADLAQLTADDPRVFGVAFEQSDGMIRELVARFPIPLHRGHYAGDAVYERGDEVILDGSTWLALIDHPTTAPPSEEWQLCTLRGSRGKMGPAGPRGETGEKGDRGNDGVRGERGERGLQGVSITGVELEAPGIIRLQYDDQTVSPPLDVNPLRYVGVYRPGATYEAGDIARLGFSLFVARVRTALVPNANTEDWALFLPGVEPSSGGMTSPLQGLHFQGIWQVAVNTPDISIGAWEPGDFFLAETVDPGIGEIADAAIPGIGGELIHNGDWILRLPSDVWQRLGGTGLTRSEADLLYVFKIGDTMTGDLDFHKAGAGQGTAPELRWDDDSGLLTEIWATRGFDGSGNMVFRSFNPGSGSAAFMRSRPGNPARLELLGAPEFPDDAVNLRYFEAHTFEDAFADNQLYGRRNFAWEVVPPPGISEPEADLRYVLKTGDTMIGDLIVGTAAWPTFVRLSGDLNTAGIELHGADIATINFTAGTPAIRRWSFGTTAIQNQDMDLEVVRWTANGTQPESVPFRIYRTGGVQIEEELFLHKMGAAAGVTPAIRWADDGGNIAWVYATRFAPDRGGLIFRTEDPTGAHTLMRSRPGSATIPDDPSRLELMAEPVEPQDAVTKGYVDTTVANLDDYVRKTGDTLTGTLFWSRPIGVGGNRINADEVLISDGVVTSAMAAGLVLSPWFEATGDPGGYGFGQFGADGGLYKRFGGGLILRQSSGDQRPLIESNDGTNNWEIHDERSGGFRKDNTAPATFGVLRWYEREAGQDTSLVELYASRRTDTNEPSVLVRLPGQGAEFLFRSRIGSDGTPRLFLYAEPETALDAATKDYVDRAAGGGIPEAPIDANVWGRNNQSWTEVVPLGGGTMTGLLTLSDDPVDPLHAATKRYVDFAVATGDLYQGSWAVGLNDPDLTQITPQHGYRYLCTTADPDVPELVPILLPGLPQGTRIFNGSFIIWDEPLLRWELLQAATGGLTQDLADTLYLSLNGGNLVGPLTLAADPVGALEAATKQYVDGSVGAGGPFLPLSGGLMTGLAQIHFGLASGAGAINIWNRQIAIYAHNQSSSTSDVLFEIGTQGSPAWQFGGQGSTNAGAAGGDAGDFVIGSVFNTFDQRIRFRTPHTGGNPANSTDRMTTIYTPVTVTGAITAATVPTDDAHVTNKRYVDQTVGTVTAAFIDRAGDAMDGELLLRGPIANPLSAVTREWVEQLAQGGLYAGPWQVAANIPNLITTPHVRGTRYLCLTVDPAIPELPPAGIPGLSGGPAIRNGSFIVWDDPIGQWDLLQSTIGDGMSIAEGDLRYLRLIGGTLTGELTFQNDGQGISLFGGAFFRKISGTGLVIRRSSGNQPVQIENNDGSNRQAIITAAGGAFNGGISFGSVAQATPADLSRHIALYAATFGFSITSGRLNYVVPTANSHNFLCGTADRLVITNTEVRAMDTHLIVRRTGTADAHLYLDADGMKQIDFRRGNYTGRWWINTGNATDDTFNIAALTNAGGSYAYLTIDRQSGIATIPWGLNFGGSGSGVQIIESATTPTVRTRRSNTDFFHNTQALQVQHSGNGIATNNAGRAGVALYNYNSAANGGLRKHVWALAANADRFEARNGDSGSAYVRVGGAGWDNLSDLRMKRDVTTVGASEAADAFAALRPIRFRWSNDRNREPDELPPDDRLHWGLAADDMMVGAADVVSLSDEGMKMYDVAGVLAIAVAKIKQLEKEIAALRKASSKR